MGRLDLYFWYKSGFGSPVARAQGIGYIQELVARLTQTPIATVQIPTFSVDAGFDTRTAQLEHE